MLPLLIVATLWLAPVTPFTPVHPFAAPAHTYAPGHRGLDVRANVGQEVRSPIAGTVTFAGRVAGRGIVTVTSGTTKVSLEPIEVQVAAGATVGAGTRLGTVAAGHCPTTCLHIGVRDAGEYVNPARLFIRVRLLPLR